MLINKNYVIPVCPDDITIDKNATGELQVKDNGLTVAKFNSDAISTTIPATGAVDTKVTTEKAVDDFGKAFAKSGSMGITVLNQDIQHTNSITAQTTAKLGKIKYDAQGHITESVETPLVTIWSATTEDTNIPSEKLVKTYIDNIAIKTVNSIAVKGTGNILTGDLSFDELQFPTAPTQLTISGDTITFSEVTGATSYQVVATDSATTYVLGEVNA